MKKFAFLTPLVFAAALSFSSVTTYAQTFLFDFGNTTSGSAGVPATDGNYWNNITSGNGATVGFKLENLVTTDNVSSSLTLEIVKRFNGENTNGTKLSAVYPLNATRDSLYGNVEAFGVGSNILPEFKITGLDTTKTYDFTFFASRTNEPSTPLADNRETVYTVTGALSGSVALNAANNVNETVSMLGVVPDASGAISIALTPGANNNNPNHFIYLNVLEMTAIPEPSTAACLLGGMAVLIARRRRSA